MKYQANSPSDYISQIPNERKKPLHRLRKEILDNLSKGTEEAMSYGMLGYVIPFGLIGELASKVTAKEWIQLYEDSYKIKDIDTVTKTKNVH